MEGFICASAGELHRRILGSLSGLLLKVGQLGGLYGFCPGCQGRPLLPSLPPVFGALSLVRKEFSPGPATAMVDLDPTRENRGRLQGLEPPEPFVETPRHRLEDIHKPSFSRRTWITSNLNPGKERHYDLRHGEEIGGSGHGCDS